jgi:hypothetical protein
MGLITLELFATLDLVAQSPGSPEEDPENFPYGGWQVPLLDEVSGAQVDAAYEGTDALLLGRRTYDIFAAYWPSQNGSFATLFNAIPKYVASRGTPDLRWDGSTQLGPDLVGAVRCVRSEIDTTISKWSEASTWCRLCCARSSSIDSICGYIPSFSEWERECSPTARYPAT